MTRTSFSLEVFGDKAAMQNYGSQGSNEKYINHLKKMLRNAISMELTECQRLAVEEYYFRGKSVSEIAAAQGVNKSTISRNLKRGKEKLAIAMRYSLSPIYLDRD